jgi:hypothetical protein
VRARTFADLSVEDAAEVLWRTCLQHDLVAPVVERFNEKHAEHVGEVVDGILRDLTPTSPEGTRA